MYADLVTSGKKTSVKDRLNGNLNNDLGSIKQLDRKRQRSNDDKWTHDLYSDDVNARGPQNSKVGVKDLRLKLQRKSSQQTIQSGRTSQATVQDLREKLSGSMHPQPENIDLPKPMHSLSEVTKSVKKNTTSVSETPTSLVKKIAIQEPPEKKTQKKVDTSVDGLLQSLGLEKYMITFKAEEIDMTALVHMTDEDLKALGIPMGPRKKILLALNSRS